MRYDKDAALKEVLQRSEKIKQKRERRVSQLLSSVTAFLSVALLVAFAGLIGPAELEQAGSAYGSFMLSREAGGYVLVAVIAFTIGVIVTMLAEKRRKETVRNDQA